MKIKLIILTAILSLVFASAAKADKMIIPMDLAQTNHLKAYGVAYWVIKNGQPVDWALNYRGGSFITAYTDKIANECRIRGVSFNRINESESSEIYAEAQDDDVNMDIVKLEKAPKIGVYAPPGSQPWDDAVRLALDYAEIDCDIIWDEEVLAGELQKYDWLHLHHEDFTGQYGKFWAAYKNKPWYIEQVTLNESTAKKLGYKKVSEMKKDVVLKITEYVKSGGFLFAMCSGTDTFDIALAALNVDICPQMFDGDPVEPNVNQKLNYENTFAFKDFKLITNPHVYEFSEIDVRPNNTHKPEIDYFTLFEFSAKYDPVPTMLTQCHVNVIRGFMGQTTAFHKRFVKKSVIIMAEREGSDEVKYIHGNVGKGTFTWYAGHDPEDYRHMVGEEPTDLNLYKNSPGYRLILNNILFPAAKKKKLKT